MPIWFSSSPYMFFAFTRSAALLALLRCCFHRTCSLLSRDLLSPYISFINSASLLLSLGMRDLEYRGMQRYARVQQQELEKPMRDAIEGMKDRMGPKDRTGPNGFDSCRSSLLEEPEPARTENFGLGLDPTDFRNRPDSRPGLVLTVRYLSNESVNSPTNSPLLNYYVSKHNNTKHTTALTCMNAC